MWKIIGIMLYLSVLSVLDIREKQVPVAVLAAGMAAACIIRFGSGLGAGADWTDEFREVMLGVMPGLFLLCIAWLTKKAGYGDGIVLLILGILQGYLLCAVQLCISLFLLSLFSIGLLSLHKACRNTKLPYIPFLTAAFMCSRILFGQKF